MLYPGTSSLTIKHHFSHYRKFQLNFFSMCVCVWVVGIFQTLFFVIRLSERLVGLVYTNRCVLSSHFHYARCWIFVRNLFTFGLFSLACFFLFFLSPSSFPVLKNFLFLFLFFSILFYLVCVCFSSIVGLERHIARCFKNSHIEDRVWEIFKRFFQTIDAGVVVVVVVGLTHARKSCLHGATPSLVNVYFSPVPITTRESLIFLSSRLSYVYTTTSSFLGFLLYIPISSPATFNSVWLSPSSPSFYLSNSIEFSFSCCCCCCCWHSIRFPPFFFGTLGACGIVFLPRSRT